MVKEDHILENPTVDVASTAHAWPGAAARKLHMARRCIFGYLGSFEIQVIGRGGHGSWPHEYVDFIAVVDQIHSGLQQVVSRCFPETALRVLSVYIIYSGLQGKRNIISDCCTTMDILRADELEVVERMEDGTKRIAQGIAAVNGAFAGMMTGHGRAIINSLDTVLLCFQSVVGILDKEHVKLDTKPCLGGEDPGKYIPRVPGTYAYASVATGKDNGTLELHSSNFMLEESMIPKMVAVFTRFVVDFLEKGRF